MQAKNQDNSGTGGLILIAAVLALGSVFYHPNGTQTATGGSVDTDHARAFVAGDMAFGGNSITPNPSPQPDPKPAPGKCPVCNGTGKVGDGRIFVDCGTCGGDGVVEAGSACKCGPDCKCATTPNNPDCKCDKCACDLAKGFSDNTARLLAKMQEEIDSAKQEQYDEDHPAKEIGGRQVILYRNPAYPLPVSEAALEALKNAGWTIGEHGQINVANDTAEMPHGTWALTEGGRVLATEWYDMTAKQVGAFYESGKIAKAASKQSRTYRRVQQCGPNGCTIEWVPE
jgi:hypothetical protein